MNIGLVEINPGRVTLYRFSSTSGKSELLSFKNFKSNKIVNDFLTPHRFKSITYAVNDDLDRLSRVKVSKVSIIAIGDFPPLFIQKLNKELKEFYRVPVVNYINNNKWIYYVKDTLKQDQLNIWFESTYVKIGYVRDHLHLVHTFLEEPAEINLEGRLSLFDLPRVVNEIFVSVGKDLIVQRHFRQDLVRLLVKMYPRAVLNYSLSTFSEIYAGVYYSTFHDLKPPALASSNSLVEP